VWAGNWRGLSQRLTCSDTDCYAFRENTRTESYRAIPGDIMGVAVTVQSRYTSCCKRHVCLLLEHACTICIIFRCCTAAHPKGRCEIGWSSSCVWRSGVPHSRPRLRFGWWSSQRQVFGNSHWGPVVYSISIGNVICYGNTKIGRVLHWEGSRLELWQIRSQRRSN